MGSDALLNEASKVVQAPRVLFVYPIEATFVRTDQRLLGSLGRVIPFHFRSSADYPKLIAEVARSDIVFCWFALGFAAVATAIAKALDRKSVVVSGGWDITQAPEIGYGRLLYFRGRVQARLALRLADRVLAFSNWSAAAIRAIVPAAKVDPIYLGVDTEAFRPGEKEDLVVCVANVSRENLARKGLRSFILAAAQVPSARFVLAGRHLDEAASELRALAPDNAELAGWLPDQELRGLLARARVYVQTSYVEGFGLAIAEAMAAGCVPVVTPAGAIPEVVGSAGLYVPYGDVQALANAIGGALRSSRGAEARARIATQFRLEQRLGHLQAVMDELLGQQPRADLSSLRQTPDTTQRT